MTSSVRLTESETFGLSCDRSGVESGLSCDRSGVSCDSFGFDITYRGESSREAEKSYFSILKEAYTGIDICKSIVNDSRHGNYICKSEGIYLTNERRIEIPVEFTYVNQ